MAGNKKISGLGFNVFAIVGLLVILPFSVAQLTSFNVVTDEDWDSLIETPMNTTNLNSFDNVGLSWENSGKNMTSAYLADTTNSYNTFNENDEYNCMWLNPELPLDPQVNSQRTVCEIFGTFSSTISNTYNGQLSSTPSWADDWMPMGKTHNWLNTFGGNNQYIGYSGNEFSFTVEENIFHNMDNNKDLANFQILMQDFSTIWVQQYGEFCPFLFPQSICDDAAINGALVQNLTFDYDIEFFYDVPYDQSHSKITDNMSNSKKLKFEDFQFDGTNQLCYTDFLSVSYNYICSFGIELIFPFTPFEVIEFSEWVNNNGGNYSKISARVSIESMDNPDYGGEGIGSMRLPFAGVGEFQVQVNAQYSNPTKINFYMKGGTFILGAGLFWLAIASTPYYDPIRNTFKGSI